MEKRPGSEGAPIDLPPLVQPDLVVFAQVQRFFQSEGKAVATGPVEVDAEVSIAGTIEDGAKRIRRHRHPPMTGGDKLELTRLIVGEGIGIAGTDQPGLSLDHDRFQFPLLPTDRIRPAVETAGQEEGLPGEIGCREERERKTEEETSILIPTITARSEEIDRRDSVQLHELPPGTVEGQSGAAAAGPVAGKPDHTGIRRGQDGFFNQERLGHGGLRGFKSEGHGSGGFEKPRPDR